MQEQQMKMQGLQFSYGMYKDKQSRDDAFKMADLNFQRDLQKMSMQFEQSKQMQKYQDQIQNGDINSNDQYLVDKAIGNNVDQLMKQYD